MKVDFKRELESASKGMIMIHDPKLLIKLIVRMIVRKLGLKHAGMILYEPDKDSYILSISRGEQGVKVPQGFTKFTRDSALIKLFSDKAYRPMTNNRSAILAEDINKLIWQEGVLTNGTGQNAKALLQKFDQQMQMFNSVACVPAYYRNKLMAVLLLGEKYDSSKFEKDELDFFAALASDAAMAIRNAQLFHGLRREAKRNRELFIQTIIVLGSTIEAKDRYTHGHTERVTNFSLAIARQMAANGSYTFKESFFENLYISGLLHDIGKIGVPESILNKTGQLTADEYEIMKSHTTRGVEIVKPLNLPQETVDGIHYHHERYDGKGYPEGLSGDDIPISAAIMAVGDTFDAMTTDRPYRKGLTREAAAAEIKRMANTQFNPIPVKAFLELWEEGSI